MKLDIDIILRSVIFLLAVLFIVCLVLSWRCCFPSKNNKYSWINTLELNSESLKPGLKAIFDGYGECW